MKRVEARVFSAHFPERRVIQCPKCHIPMSLTTVTGITVEKCPSCEGTFFDKGEVESLVRRKVRFQQFKLFRLFRWN